MILESDQETKMEQSLSVYDYSDYNDYYSATNSSFLLSDANISVNVTSPLYRPPVRIHCYLSAKADLISPDVCVCVCLFKADCKNRS